VHAIKTCSSHFNSGHPKATRQSAKSVAATGQIPIKLIARRRECRNKVCGARVVISIMTVRGQDGTGRDEVLLRMLRAPHRRLGKEPVHSELTARRRKLAGTTRRPAAGLMM